MACDWGSEVTFAEEISELRRAHAARSAHHGARQNHPVTAGLGDGFDIVDETYMCPVDEKIVHPLLKTDFVNIDQNYESRYAGGWRYPGVGSSLAGWYRAVGKSPLVYLQNGHDAVAWANPAYQKL